MKMFTVNTCIKDNQYKTYSTLHLTPTYFKTVLSHFKITAVILGVINIIQELFQFFALSHACFKRSSAILFAETELAINSCSKYNLQVIFQSKLTRLLTSSIMHYYNNTSIIQTGVAYMWQVSFTHGLLQHICNALSNKIDWHI